MPGENVGQMDQSTVWERSEGDHSLQTSWAFWYDKKQHRKQQSDEFRASLHKLGSFDTVESFWKMFVYLKRPSKLENNVNLYLFRDGPNIAPMWECFPSGKMWQDMVFATIGDLFEEPDVVGVSVSIRSREDLISVWNADNRNEEIRFRI
eukprot:gene57857-77206_t